MALIKRLSGGRGGLTVTALDFGSKGPNSRPGFVAVLCSWAKRLTHSASLHPGISVDTREFSGKPDVILGGNLRMNWRPIPGGGGVVIFLGT